MKHKHAELIKAWADGAEIQYLHIGKESNEWQPFNYDGRWLNEIEYRIKPKDDLITFWKLWNDGAYLCSRTNIEMANIKIIFDGETGELKSAEVLK